MCEKSNTFPSNFKLQLVGKVKPVQSLRNVLNCWPMYTVYRKIKYVVKTTPINWKKYFTGNFFFYNTGGFITKLEMGLKSKPSLALNQCLYCVFIQLNPQASISFLMFSLLDLDVLCRKTSRFNQDQTRNRFVMIQESCVKLKCFQKNHF